MKIINIILWLGICILSITPHVYANVEVQKTKEIAVEIWELLLESRMGELQSVRQEVLDLSKQVPEISQTFSDELNKIEQSYQHYITMAKVSRGLPIELSLVDERLKKLSSDLNKVLQPVKEMLNLLKARLKEISLLEQGKSLKANYISGDPKLQQFVENLDQTESRLNILEKRFYDMLHPADLLQKNIKVQQDEFALILPRLWRNYYFTPTEKLYEPSSWFLIKEGLFSLKESFLVRVNAEFPEDKQAWITVLLQDFFLIIPLTLIILGIRKLFRKLPETVREQSDRIVKHSLPFLFFGFICHFSAWAPTGENYYLISILGTVFMCLGQVDLAWNLYKFDKFKQFYSPLFKLLIPLFWGIFLLTINFPGIILSSLWISGLLFALYVDHRYLKSDANHMLVKNIFLLHRLILWISIIMAVLGWVRLSILCCMGYAALVVCIQQAFGFIGLTNFISENTSQEGLQGLVSGMLLAVFLPAAIILVSSFTCLWVLAYPGGAYLITHLTQLDFSIGKVSFNLVQVLLVVSLFYVTRSFISVGRMFISSLPDQNARIDRNLIVPIRMVFTYATWGLFGIYILYLLGLNLTSLAVVAGGLSVGIGFGLQNIMNNFVSGILIVFGQTIREGDVIEVSNNLMGVVRKINMRATLVETFDNATIVVPNAELLSGRLTNWTRNGRSVRRDVAVGVAYGSNVGLVMELLKNIANEHPRVLHFPEPVVIFNDFGSSSLDFLLRFWVGDISQALDITSELRITISEIFAEQNIEIAFPQLDIHVRKGSILAIEQKFKKNEGLATFSTPATTTGS